MTSREGRRSGGTVALATMLPWLIHVAVLAAISAVERSASPEATAEDRVLDITINGVALAGLVVAAVWSVTALRHGRHPARRGALLALVLAGGFIGPLLATVVVTAIAHDVDGSTWMLFSPALGLLFVAASLLVMVRVETRRRKRAG